MRFEWFWAASFAFATGAAASEVIFQPIDVARHDYTGGWEHFVGGGVAVFDCDGDHLPELFAAGGAGASTLYRNISVLGEAVAYEPETSDETALTDVIGAYPVDFDGDGLVDLAVLRVGANQLLRNTGECRFKPFAPKGFDGGEAWTTAFSATWEAGQERPTLAFGNYVDRDDPEGPFQACDDNILFRPEPSGGYARVILSPGYCALSMLFSDWGRQGQADLRVSNDRHYYVRGGEEQLWQLGDAPRALTKTDGWNRFSLWGMGIASRDIDFDGLPEVYLTSMGDQRLQRLTETDRPSFADVPYEMGTTAHRPYMGDDGRPSTGWHVAFGDMQNDGLDDAFIAKGNVEQMPDSAMEDPNNLLIQQADGRFAEAGDRAGVASVVRSRGAAVADFDLDGRLDLVVANRRAPLEVYRNETSSVGNWVGFSLEQGGGNTKAVGAWIELRALGRTYSREITIGGGHAGGVAGPEHFGIGKDTSVQVRVIWPDGVVSDWEDVAANSYYSIKRSQDGLQVDRY